MWITAFARGPLMHGILNSMVRAFIGGLSFAGALFASPWLPLVCAGILTVRFRAWEVLALGVFIDILYVPSGWLYGIPIPATLASFILIVGFEPIRRKLLV